jgi:hypothetical protein
LGELYQEIICEQICILVPGTFAQQVATHNQTSRPLLLDFLVGIPELGTWGVEVDGPQHYEDEFFGKDTSRVAECDRNKVKVCADQGIQIARLPLPILPTLDRVFEELDTILAGKPKYLGIPQRSWITK